MACIKFDLDRYKIAPLAGETKLRIMDRKKAGWSFYDVYPPTSPDALAYVCEAFTKYQNYWFR